MPPPSPTISAWELGIRLREAREHVGVSAAAAAKKLGISQNYLSDVERGKRKLIEEKLATLISHYSVEDGEREELLCLRHEADERGWWFRYIGLFADEVLRLFGCEHGADHVRLHEGLLIPGLLQTADYAYEIVTSDSENIRTSDADQRVEARLRRQSRLTDDDPLRLSVVMSEGAVKQQVGGTAVLADQLRHLINMIEELPNTLELRVIPFTAGAHGALGASTFHLLGFSNPRLSNLVWKETITSWVMVSSPARVNEYNATFSQSMRHALDKQGSRDLIHRELKAIT